MTDILTSEKRSAAMARIRTVDTKPEREVRSQLFRLGFRFRKNVKELPGRPDIVLPRYRVVIFVHGCFWHGHDCSRGKLPKSNAEFWNTKIRENIERDHAMAGKLMKLGWRVFVVWSCSLVDDTANIVKELEKAKEKIPRPARVQPSDERLAR